ncbi:MAG: laminin G domain-containing protein, partial [Candidatus Aenigmarchaeota archaeon]|nr:laminin G domain-containing protein [Candidatus Aenigmarchaeota archaeon]
INPDIYFVSPTPDPDDYINEDYAYINVTAMDTNNITAFIDWNNSLIGWWRFNEGSGNIAYDSSSYSNDMTVYVYNESMDNWTTGKFGKALQFDGSNDYVERSFDTDFTPGTSSWTIEGWVKFPEGDTGRMIVNWYRCGANPSCGGADSASYRLYIDGFNKANWYVRDDNANLEIITSSFSVADNYWHHIVGSFDPTNDLRKLYVDGIEVNSSSAVITSFSDGGLSIPLSIGRHFITGWGSPSSYFNGTIDEVKIWNRALTAEEINASYNAGIYRLETNYTNLDEGTYDYTAYAQDLAGNFNNTETRTITIDTINPDIYFVSPTPEPDEYRNEDYAYINVTSTDTNNITAFIDWNNSLVGWWRFDNSSDLSDHSTYSNDGTNAGTTYTESGKFGGARVFNGVDNSVGISHSNSLTFGASTDFSFEAWFKSPGSAFTQTIIDTRDSSSAWQGVGVTLGVANVGFFIQDYQTDSISGGSSGDYNDNSWHHVTLVADRDGTAKIYV